jgi:hypothetical protein
MTDIVERLRAYAEDATDLGATEEAEIITCAADEIERLRAERDELEDSFDMRWEADMRAIKKWQAANQGNDLVWPDHADLVVWLMAERDRLREALERAADTLSDASLLDAWADARAALKGDDNG